MARKMDTALHQFMCFEKVTKLHHGDTVFECLKLGATLGRVHQLVFKKWPNGHIVKPFLNA